MRQLIDGAGCLLRGLGIFFGTPGMWVLGLVPALLALLVLGGLVAVLAVALPGMVTAMTPFAAGWSPDARDVVRLLIGAAIVVGALWLSMISYTALAIAIGQPFYEVIADRVEAREGGVTEPARRGRWWRGIVRALRDGLLLVVLTSGLSVLLFALGFVPVFGQTVVPVLGACVTGWFLAVELTAIALERRGLRLGDRLRLLWRRRLLTLGFGLAVFALFLVPLGAVIGMPGAVAGGTLLARRLGPT
ncbi:MAG TPA: EI24 domain-containing protein [Candidatus Dormibacteraeota bacterium]|nr:EI24 domain-containing protein [Candidatus Dormibacteraeota bacterium]